MLGLLKVSCKVESIKGAEPAFLQEILRSMELPFCVLKQAIIMRDQELVKAIMS